MDLWTLKAGDRVRISDGPVAEILEETADGLWVKVRYLEGASSATTMGSEDRCYKDEVAPMIDDGTESREGNIETGAYASLIEAAANMLGDVQAEDDPPPAFISDGELFRQLLELMVEEVHAIRVLCHHGLYRPAYAVLRTFVETTAKLAWISRDVHRRSGVFLSSKRHDMKTLLKEIGWEDEYERTYKIFNHYIHTDPKVSATGFYRTYEWGEGDLFPEIGPETKHYLCEMSHGAAVLGENLMSRYEARQLYEPFLAVKVFDIALAGLRLLYGNTSVERGWWPGEVLPTFVRICDRVPGLAALIRWPSA